MAVLITYLPKIFDMTGAQNRLHQRFVRFDRIVDRGARCPGLSPKAKRAVWIQPDAFLESGDGGSVREGMSELHAIVEKRLGLRHRRADRKAT